jgi:hypothetical protein
MSTYIYVRTSSYVDSFVMCDTMISVSIYTVWNNESVKNITKQ